MLALWTCPDCLRVSLGPPSVEFQNFILRVVTWKIALHAVLGCSSKRRISVLAIFHSSVLLKGLKKCCLCSESLLFRLKETRTSERCVLPSTERLEIGCSWTEVAHMVWGEISLESRCTKRSVLTVLAVKINDGQCDTEVSHSGAYELWLDMSGISALCGMLLRYTALKKWS